MYLHTAITNSVNLNYRVRELKNGPIFWIRNCYDVVVSSSNTTVVLPVAWNVGAVRIGPDSTPMGFLCQSTMPTSDS